MSVCPSLRLSVCLSHAGIVTKLIQLDHTVFIIGYPHHPIVQAGKVHLEIRTKSPQGWAANQAEVKKVLRFKL